MRVLARCGARKKWSKRFKQKMKIPDDLADVRRLYNKFDTDDWQW